MSTSYADLAVAAVRQYHRQHRPAITVSYLDSLTRNRWTELPEFHERVKYLAYQRHGIELMYVYESQSIRNVSGEIEPHWAVMPTEDSAADTAIRQRYSWERLGQMQTEFERLQQRSPIALPVIAMIGGQLNLARQFVACPDPARTPDLILDYIRSA